MNIFPLLLQIAALVCLLFAAFNLVPRPNPQWGWLGLFLLLLSWMVSGIYLHPTYGVH